MPQVDNVEHSAWPTLTGTPDIIIARHSSFSMPYGATPEGPVPAVCSMIRVRIEWRAVHCDMCPVHTASRLLHLSNGFPTLSFSFFRRIHDRVPLGCRTSSSAASCGESSVLVVPSVPFRVQKYVLLHSESTHLSNVSRASPCLCPSQRLRMSPCIRHQHFLLE